MCDWVSALAVVTPIDPKTCLSADECGAGLRNRFIKSVEVNCKAFCGNCLIANITTTPEGNQHGSSYNTHLYHRILRFF